MYAAFLDLFAVGAPLVGARPAIKQTKKGRQNADRRCSVTSAPCGAALPPPLPSPAFSISLPRLRGREGWGQRRGQLACRRSAADSPEGLSSQRLSFRPGFLRLGRTVGPVSFAQPGAKDLALFHGRYPRQPVPVQGCTSPTGRSAGLRDARSGPGNGPIFPPAGTALAPPAGVPSAEGVPSERDS
jgi:hypothetical protein